MPHSDHYEQNNQISSRVRYLIVNLEYIIDIAKKRIDETVVTDSLISIVKKLNNFRSKLLLANPEEMSELMGPLHDLSKMMMELYHRFDIHIKSLDDPIKMSKVDRLVFIDKLLPSIESISGHCDKIIILINTDRYYTR